MRILYILWNYPQLSETYIEAEMAFAARNGFQVEVWSTAVQTAGVPENFKAHRGTLAQAVADFKPHLIHIHYLPVADRYLPEMPHGIPVTVRAHSFDWSDALCMKVLADRRVRRVYAFPHFTELLRNEKLMALPVAYAADRFPEAASKDRKMVLRLAAGLPNKGLADFVVASRGLPRHRFVLAVAVAGISRDYPAKIREEGHGSVDVRIDVPWGEAAALTGRAGIYMDTSDPGGHPFGMPISIAEAMSTGSLVLARRSPEAVAYCGDAALYYSNPSVAIELIQSTEAWTDMEWATARDRSVARARLFADSSVLPKLLEAWRSFV